MRRRRALARRCLSAVSRYAWETAVVAVLVVGLILSAAVFARVRRMQEKHLGSDLRRSAEAYAAALEQELDCHFEIVNSIRGYFDGSEHVTRTEFRQFCAGALERHSDIRALGWVACVPHGQRQAWETEVREDELGTLHITEISDDGEAAPAPERPEYFPVSYLEPRTWREAHIGLDLGSDPTQLSALRNARDRGEMAATRCVASSDGEMRLYQAVFEGGGTTETVEGRRRRLRGFGVGVFSTATVVEHVLALHTPVGLDVWLLDNAAPAEEQVLHYHASRTRSGQEPAMRGSFREAVGLEESLPLRVADRQWTLLVRPAPAFLARHPHWGAFAVGISIASFTVFVSASLAMAGSAMRRSRSMARQRADALQRIEAAHEVLQEHEQRSRTILNTVQSGIMVVDAETRRIRDVNAAVAAMVGRPREDIVGRVCHRVICPAGGGICPICDLGHEIDNSERELLTADGRRVPVLKSARLASLDGVECVVESFLDLTERKEMEQQLQRDRRLAAVGTLARGVAHEINNPIGGVMGYAELIKDRLCNRDEGLRPMADGIIQQAKRISTLTSSLLQFAEPHLQGCAPARMCDIVEAVCALGRPTLRSAHIRLTVDVPSDLPKVLCRTQQIQQVLTSLITNARDALSVGVSATGDREIQVAATPVNGDGRLWVRTTVADNGVGIAEELRDAVFDPFATTKDRTAYAGLGLSVSYGIVKEHGGELSIESEPGVFTRVHMDLPAEPEVDHGRCDQTERVCSRH